MSVRDTARNILDIALVRSPAQTVCARRSQKSLAVLAYHDVHDTARFRQQMEFICRKMRPVSLDEVILAVQSRKALPAGAVLVTFDDGHRSVVENGLPILREYNIPAVVFVIAGLIGTDQPFWWDEAGELWGNGGRSKELTGCRHANEVTRRLKDISNERRLQAMDELRTSASCQAQRQSQLSAVDLQMLEDQGIAVGNHTNSHPCLQQCDTKQIEQELAESQQVLASILGHSPRALAYPNGDDDPRVNRAVKKCGFDVAFLFDHRLAPNPPDNTRRISRLRVNSDTSLDRFKIVLSGLHPRIHTLLRRN